jgi:hypothetical protein
MNDISFSKISATPTLNSWSQAYNAGKLFAVLSLEKIHSEKTEDHLNTIGKKLLENLESEFFSLANKDLISIKDAISSTFSDLAQGVDVSFATAAFVDNILYVFSLGQGKVFVKRGKSLGMIADSQKSAKEISSSSGFLENNDQVILCTNDFLDVVDKGELQNYINEDSVQESTESLAPKVHKAENGKVAAIIIKYKNPHEEEQQDNDDIQDQMDTEEHRNISAAGSELGAKSKALSNLLSTLGVFLKKVSKIKPTKKKILLITALVIAVFLVANIFSSIQSRENEKIQAEFQEIFDKAEKKYDEGESVLDLNKKLSKEAFIEAQKILNDNKEKFSENNELNKQINDLLEKIDNGLSQTSSVDDSGLDRASVEIIIANGSGQEGAAGKASAIMEAIGYNIVSTENADNFDYEGLTIKTKEDKERFIELLKKDLSKEYEITKTSSDLSTDSSYDILVIVGK